MLVYPAPEPIDWHQLHTISFKIDVNLTSKKDIKKEFKKSDISDQRKIIHDLFVDFLKNNEIETEEQRSKINLAAELYAEASEKTRGHFYLHYSDNKPFMKIFSTAMASYYMFINELNKNAPISFEKAIDQQIWFQRYEELKNS